MVERLQTAQAAGRRDAGQRPRREPATARAMARICSGVVPQQPPTMLTKPLRREFAPGSRPSAAASRHIRRRHSAGRHSDRRTRRCRRCARVPRCTGRSCLPPSAQLSPTTAGRACRMEFQNASVVWPDRVRPEASVIVPETMMGRSMPRLVEHLAHGEQRRLGIQRIEYGFDQDACRRRPRSARARPPRSPPPIHRS